MPTNISPATALEIFPSENGIVILGVNEAPTGTTNIPTCVVTPRNALWFKYTPDDWLNYFRITAYNFETSYTVYQPNISIWIGTPSSLTLLIIVDGGGDDQEYCDDTYLTDGASPLYFAVPILVPGTVYYIQVCNHGVADAPVGSKLKVQLEVQKNFAVPAGSYIIPDDIDGFPAVIFSPVSGAILQQRTFPAGEQTSVFADGKIITQNGSADNSFALLSSQLVGISTYNLPGTLPLAQGVWTDQLSYWYVYVQTGPGPYVYKLLKIDSATQTLIHSTTLDKAYLNGAVSPDGAFFYGAFNDGTNKIDKWTLATDTKTTTWSNILHWYSHGAVFSGFCKLDGTIVLAESPDGIEQRVGTFSSATGALVSSYGFQGIVGSLIFNRMAYISETQFVIWALNIAGTLGYFVTINYDNSVTVFAGPFDVVNGSAGPNSGSGWASNSCPIFVNKVAIEPITPTVPPLPGPIPPSGADPAIYKLVKDKRNDTYYNDVDNETTVDTRIPDIFAVTSLIGDE